MQLHAHPNTMCSSLGTNSIAVDPSAMPLFIPRRRDDTVYPRRGSYASMGHDALPPISG
jgi:hypothetical protein